MGTSEPAAKRVRFMDSSCKMGTSEPPAKSFMDCEVTIDFSNPTIFHDRILLVDGQKFHIQSQFLSQYSKFFDAFFNIKHEHEDAIELKDIPAADFDNFLRALSPMRLQVTGENLAGLMKLSVLFSCPIVWGLCLQFLKNKDELIKFSPAQLLQWSEGSDSQELKTLIEQDLIERSVINSNTVLEELVGFLNLAQNYSPDKLKELLEEFIFNDPQRKEHISLVDLLYYSEKYDLPKVRKILDEFFCRLPFDRPGQVHLAFLVRKICRLPEFEVKVFDYMLQFVNNINEDKKFPPLELENYEDTEQMKNLAVDFLCKMYARIDKTQVVVGNFLQIALQYNVLQLQKDVEANLVDDFLNKNGLEYMNLAVKYNLQELKDLISDYLTRINSSELSEEDQQILLNVVILNVLK